MNCRSCQGSRYYPPPRYIPYICLFIALFLLHLPMQLNLGDDGNFAKVLQSKSLLQHMANLYWNVNGKILPDTMAAVFTYLPPLLFKTLNTLAGVLIAWCIRRLFLPQSTFSACAACCAVLMFPLSLLRSAGWVATSTNYWWCSAGLLTALLPIVYYMKGVSIPTPCKIFAPLAAFYAGNQEQTCAVLLVVYCGVCLLWRKKRRPDYGFLLFQGLLSLACLALLLTAPGHVHRVLEYSQYRVVDYPNWTFFEKLHHGFTSTMASLLSGIFPVTLLFLSLCCFLVFRKTKQLLPRLIAAAPLGLYLITSYGYQFFRDFLPFLPHFRYYYAHRNFGLSDFTYINAYTYDQESVYLPVILSIGMVFCIGISLYVIYGAAPKTLLHFTTLGAGLASRISIGFSPTIYGSSTRTMTLLCLSLIVTSVQMFLDARAAASKWQRRSLTVLALALCAATVWDSWCAIR
ncbi:MAG TPA: hypothetical protein IAC31_06085 [Candidatus Faecousia intestinigallinarum]|nr:hypothetical protein [Candidatus Faecousia intestinigallinarum]